MRLLTVTHYFGSHGGGIERVAERLADELAGLGHEVSWLASDASAAPARTSVRTQGLRSWHWVERKLGVPFPVPRPAALATLNREVAAADAVLLHDCLYLSNLAAFLLARRWRKPVAIVQHIGTVPYRNPLLRLLMRVANRLLTETLLARADQAVFISELTRSHYRRVRFRAEPLVAFNGVDSALFRPSSQEHGRSQLRSRLGLAPDARLVAFAGRFVEKKGLEVVERLAAARPGLTFLLAGKGPIDPAAWQLPNVRVLGQLSGEQLADLYRGSDLLLLPSTGEGFPLVIQEALACGLPVLCGDETARADAAARPYLAEATIEVGDPRRTADNFLHVLDRELARQPTPGERTERARFAADRYSWSRLGRFYDGLLTRLTTPVARAGRHDAELATG